MVRLKINQIKTYLPLSVSKGTTEERLEKARKMNLAFYKDLQYSFSQDRTIKPSVIKKTLRDITGAKISLKIFDSNILEKDRIGSFHLLNSSCTNTGYVINIPFKSYPYNDVVEQGSAPVLLKATQSFFNEIFNPKFFRRVASMVNKQQSVDDVLGFYNEYLKGVQKFSSKGLKEFLKDKSTTEQINALQLLRYRLLEEQSVAKSIYPIDKLISKIDSLHFINKDYSLEKYQYDEKLSILNKALLEVMQRERLKIKNSVL